MAISGSFLGIMLAAVMLGGPPAAIVGALTIRIGWFRSRERGDLFRHNLVTFILVPAAQRPAVPLAGGAVRRQLARTAGQPPADYYLLVFATFMVALVLNFAMVAAYEA